MAFFIYIALFFATFLALSAPAVEPRCEYRSVRGDAGLGSNGKEDCLRHCVYEQLVKDEPDFSCTYGKEKLNTQALAPCFLLNDVGSNVPLRKSLTDSFWDVVRTEAACLTDCKAASIPEDSEVCLWGKKKLFDEFPTERALCRIRESMGSHLDLPPYPIPQAECLRRTQNIRSKPVDPRRDCRNTVVRWGEENWGVPSTRHECDIRYGWPATQDVYCATLEECRADYAKVEAREEIAFVNWENQLVKHKGRPVSSQGTQRCALLDTGGKEFWGDRYDQGRPEDCRRSCQQILKRWGTDQAHTPNAPAEIHRPFRCHWDGQDLFAVKNFCAEYFKGTAPIIIAVVNPKAGFLRVPFVLRGQHERQWNVYNEGSDDCENGKIGATNFQVTFDRRTWGSISANHFLSPNGAVLGFVPGSDSGDLPQQLPAKSAAALQKLIPVKLHNKNLVLTNAARPFQDPLELRPEPQPAVDLSFLQDFLTKEGLVKKYSRNREMRASPSGKWLQLRKAYRGANGYRLFELFAAKAAIGPQGRPEAEEYRSPATELQYFVIEVKKKFVVLPLVDPANLIDAGDYDGDGTPELVFLSGDHKAGALSLVNGISGDMLARQDWGGWSGP